MDRYLGRSSRVGGRARPIMGSNGGALPSRGRGGAGPHGALGAGGRRRGRARLGAPPATSTSSPSTWAAPRRTSRSAPDRPLRTREFEIDGQPVAVPVIDIHTVGAGGGSLARVDAGGALRVGPRERRRPARADLLRAGRHEVTVTDAHVWLGTLPADGFLGGGGRSIATRFAGRSRARRRARLLARGRRRGGAARRRLRHGAGAARHLGGARLRPGRLRRRRVRWGRRAARGRAHGRLGAAQGARPPRPRAPLRVRHAGRAAHARGCRARCCSGGRRDPGTERRVRGDALPGARAGGPRGDAMEDGWRRRSVPHRRALGRRPLPGQSFELACPRTGGSTRFHAGPHERYGYRPRRIRPSRPSRCA
jgi:N-methylhydantoinase A